MSEEQKSLLEMAKKEFHDKIGSLNKLPPHVSNYIRELEKKFALMSDYAEILEKDKKVFRDLLSESRVEKIKLQVQNDHMKGALKWFLEPDRSISSDLEKISIFKGMIKPILDE